MNNRLRKRIRKGVSFIAACAIMASNISPWLVTSYASEVPEEVYYEGADEYYEEASEEYFETPEVTMTPEAESADAYFEGSAEPTEAPSEAPDAADEAEYGLEETPDQEEAEVPDYEIDEMEDPDGDGIAEGVEAPDEMFEEDAFEEDAFENDASEDDAETPDGQILENAPSVIFEDSTDEVRVTVVAGVGVFPEGTTMEVKPTEDEETINKVSETVEDEKTKVTEVKAVEVTFYNAEHEEIEPNGPVFVTLEDLTKTKEKDAEEPAQKPEEAKAVHVTDEGECSMMAAASEEDLQYLPMEWEEDQAEDSIKKIEQLNEEATVAFLAESFSTYALVYTVDFEYTDSETGETLRWSFPGQGSYSLSEIMAVLGVESTITSAELELIEGELIEGALYLTEAEGEYTLHSDVPFHDFYRLTVNTDGEVYALIITDAATYSDLSNFLYDIDIENSNNESVIENGNKIVVDFEKTYNFFFKFRETSEKQFDNNSNELYYDLPEGVDLNLINPTEFEVKIGARKITGNTYEVVNGPNGKKQIKIKFNKDHPNYAFLKGSQDVEIDLHFYGKMTKKYTENKLDFSAEVSGYTVEDKEVCNAKVKKTGRYDPNQKKMYYAVFVTATEGNPTNVSLTDTITGTALTFDSNYGLHVSQCSDENGSHKEKDLTKGTDYTVSSTSGKGFTMNINSIPTGKTVKVEYMADVDFTKIASNNNATVSETGNGVRITAEGDETPEDNESKHDEKNINFSSITKSATTVGDIVDVSGNPPAEGYTGKLYRIIDWTVVANTEGLVTLKDSAITDTLLNNAEVEYYGDGITVKKKLDGGNHIHWNEITGTPVSWADVGVNDMVNDNHWSYTPKDEGIYAYQITYQTRVDISAIPAGSSRDIYNRIEDKYDEDTGKINIKRDKKTEPTVDKSATSVSEEAITWKIAVEIPKGWTGPLVVSDTLPHIYTYYDELQSIIVDGYTKVDVGSAIGEGQYTETIENGYNYSWDSNGHRVDTYAGTKSFTLDFGTIAPSNENRTINITVVTKNNLEWVQYGMAHSDAESHTNTVSIKQGDNTIGTDNDKAQPKPRTLTKTSSKGTPFKYYHGEDSYGNSKLEGEGYIFPFTVRLTGVTTSNVDITETFDTEFFTVYEPDYGHTRYNSYTDALAVYYNSNGYNDGTRAETGATVENTDTGAIIHLTNLPRTEGNAFYGYYTVKYYLVVKEGKLDALKSFVAEHGDVVGSGDNKTGMQYIFHNRADWDGVDDSAPYTYTVENIFKKEGRSDGNGNYNYTITLNPEKLQINNNEPYELTDVFSGITVDASSISIVSDPNCASQIYTNAEQAAADTTPNKIVLLITDGQISATIPDKTKVVISYTGVPSNAITIDTQKNKAITEESNTAKALDFEYHVDYTHEHTVVAKTRKDNADGSKTYTLDLNPDKITLKGGENYPLTDTFSGINIDDDSFTVTVCDPDTDGTKVAAILASRQLNGNKYTFSIPDSTHVTITYTARPVYTADQAGNISATISNTAEVENVVSGDGPHTETHRILTKGAQTETEDGIPFSIEFNPTCETLNDGEDIELVDTFKNLIVEYSTITIVPNVYPAWHDKAGQKIEFNYSGNEGTFRVPDKTKITISYLAKPDFSVSQNVEWSNKVTANDYIDETSGTSVETHSAEGYGSLPHSLYLLKYQTGHMEIPLNGVEFKLSMDINGVKTPVTYSSGANAGEQVTFTSAQVTGKGDGYALMMPTLEEGVDATFIDPIVGGFKPDTIYYLDEVSAPEGYYNNSTSYNFVWHSSKQIKTDENGLGIRDANHEYIMEDNPNHPYVKPAYMTGQSVYVFSEGETVKITNDKITKDVEVSKNWVNGDGTWAWPEGIDKVTVKLQQKVEGEDWKDILVENGNIPSQYWNAENNDFAEGYTWSSTLDLTKNRKKKSWTDLDLEKDGKTIEYRVVEVSLTSGSTTAAFDSNNTATINGKTYVALGGTVKNGSTTLLNEEKTNVEYEKRWNVHANTFNWVVPQGVTVTDGTTTYTAGQTVAINRSDLKIKVRLHRYAWSGGDKVSTYDFPSSDSAYTKELSGSNWTASWNDLDVAAFVERNGIATEVDYIYEVEEAAVTVPASVLRNIDGTEVDLKNAFESESTKDASGKIIMTNSLKEDNNYYLTVEKEWRDSDNHPANGEPVEFKLVRGGRRITTTQGESATIYIKDAYNLNYGEPWEINNEFHIGDTVKITVPASDWFNGFATNQSEVKVLSFSKNGNISSAEITFTIISASCTIGYKDGDINGDSVFSFELQSNGSGSSSSEQISEQVMKPDPDHADQYIVDATGNFRFTINPNETVTFANLPGGLVDGTTTETYTYEVVETSTGTNWHVVTGTGTYDPKPTGSEEKGHNQTITLINQYETADLTVTKNLTKANTSGSDLSFYVGLFVDAAGTTMAADVGNNPREVKVLQNATSGTVTFNNLTIGTTYYVFETTEDGTKVSTSDKFSGYAIQAGDASGKSVTIASSNNTASITNEYSTEGTVSFAATKTFVGSTLGQGQFTFTLTEYTDNTFTTQKAGGVTQTVTNAAPAGSAAFGIVRFADVALTDTATRYFKIKEVVPTGAAADPSIIYDTLEQNVTVTVSDDGAGTLTAVKTYSSESRDDTYDALFTNTRKGSLLLTKELTMNGKSDSNTDWALTDGTYKFEIRGETGTDTAGISRSVEIIFKKGKAVSYTIDNGDSTPVTESADHTWSVGVDNLIPGRYTVREILDDDSRMTLTEILTGETPVSSVTQPVRITVNAGENVPEESTAQVTFVNNLDVGSLKVVKEFQKNGKSENASKDLTFTVGLYPVTENANNTETESQEPAVTGTVTVKKGASASEPVTFDNLMIGSKYRVYEIRKDDSGKWVRYKANDIYEELYTVGYDNQEITVVKAAADADIPVAKVINNEETGSIEVTKKVAKTNDENYKPDADASFTIALYEVGSTQTAEGSSETEETETLVGDPKVIAVKAREVTGTVRFEDLKIGGKYRIYEVTVDSDNKVTQKFAADQEFGEYVVTYENQTITIDRSKKDANKITVTNTLKDTGTFLPSTGGIGTTLFYILGSILILGAGVLLWRRRKLI